MLHIRRTSLFALVAALAAFSATSVRAADEHGDAITDTAKAGPDFAVQGEYQGKVGENDQKIGAHVIALGDGKFHGVFYHGGLPGDGWTRDDNKVEADGKTEGGETKFVHDNKSAVVKDGKMTLVNENGEKVGTLEKVERKSATLGAKPPAGAKVLFAKAGDEANWEGGKVTDDGLLRAGSKTKDKFADCKLHVEFRTPFMPKAGGQGRGNSGVYIDNRYELQVLDSFGLSGENNECGGFYQIKEPAVNMCYPPLAWQTYDIDFTAAKYEDGKKVKNAHVTVKHNGVTIHDDLELPRATPGGIGEGPEAAAMFFQDHGNPVVYRNVWVVEK
ncbi:MAG: DUF1080 domain-containing protein [Pirellulales bacterium]